MSIKMFKLVSGEFIISDFEADALNHTVEMSSPMIVQFAPHENGQLAINLFPLNPFANAKHEKIQINTNHILFDAMAPKGVEAEYIRITSGIVTPPSKPNLSIIK
jgi:hypothetical protein